MIRLLRLIIQIRSALYVLRAFELYYDILNYISFMADQIWPQLVFFLIFIIMFYLTKIPLHL